MIEYEMKRQEHKKGRKKMKAELEKIDRKLKRIRIKKELVL